MRLCEYLSLCCSNNKAWGTSRNLDPDVWIQFFRYCENRYPATFILVSARNELEPRFRECPNVVLSKDHGTGIEQDLALIDAAPLTIGSSSGLGTMAMFSTKPYCLFNSDIQYWEYQGAVREDDFVRLPFATEFQSFHIGRESPDLVIREFDRLWATLDQSEWQKPRGSAVALTAPTISWLR